MTVDLPGQELPPDPLTACFALLDAAQIEHATKDEVWRVLTHSLDGPRHALVGQLMALGLDAPLLGALVELLTADDG